jgi:2-phosphoglycerate kinase
VQHLIPLSIVLSKVKRNAVIFLYTIEEEKQKKKKRKKQKKNQQNKQTKNSKYIYLYSYFEKKEQTNNTDARLTKRQL